MSGARPEVGLEWAEKSIALGEKLGTRHELVRPLQWRGLMRCEMGDLAGIEDLERALSEAVELRVNVIPAFVNLSDMVWRQRGPAAAFEVQTAGLADRLDHGGRPIAWIQAEMCWMLFDLGRWDELLQLASEVRAFEDLHGTAQPGGMASSYASQVLSLRGLLAESASVMAAALPLAREIKDPQVLGPALVAGALLELLRADDRAALAMIAEWYEITRDRPYFRAQNLTEAVRIACATGELDLAERLLDNVVTAAERDRLSDLTARATIADARGEDATAALAEAAAGWEAFGCRFEHALALQGAGRHADADAILAELGVAVPPAQTAARTAK
jgi:hypothetical protein